MHVSLAFSIQHSRIMFLVTLILFLFFYCTRCGQKLFSKLMLNSASQELSFLPSSAFSFLFLLAAPLPLSSSHRLPLQLHCQAVPVHSLAAALRLCSRVASLSAGVWCRTKHEKNVIDVSAVAVRKSSTPATDTTPGRETPREKRRLRGSEARDKK